MDVQARFVEVLKPILPGKLLLPDEWESVLGTGPSAYSPGSIPK